MTEDFLIKRLNERKEQNAYRQLRLPDGKIDFCSNDYLGIVRERRLITDSTDRPGACLTHRKEGSTGSRLLAGNYELIERVEKEIATFHEAEAGLIFNSGYDANVGLLSCIPQRGNTIIYDFLSHASIRDGIRLSFAHSFPFAHNDLNDLEKKLKVATGNIFVVTESVFSMDGDKAPLKEIADLCSTYKAYFIVDEAHATGVVGEKGEGLLQELGLQNRCFARVHTFGKAVGCHGAIVLGSEVLRNFLINFARSFIYTTALPENSIAAIEAAYRCFPEMAKERAHLKKLIAIFQNAAIPYKILPSDTPIQVVIVPGNDHVKALAQQLQDNGLDVRPILYPTVPKDSERLRIVLHAFNSLPEVQLLIHHLTNFKRVHY